MNVERFQSSLLEYSILLLKWRCKFLTQTKVNKTPALFYFILTFRISYQIVKWNRRAGYEQLMIFCIKFHTAKAPIQSPSCYAVTTQVQFYFRFSHFAYSPLFAVKILTATKNSVSAFFPFICSLWINSVYFIYALNFKTRILENELEGKIHKINCENNARS